MQWLISQIKENIPSEQNESESSKGTRQDYCVIYNSMVWELRRGKIV